MRILAAISAILFGAPVVATGHNGAPREVESAIHKHFGYGTTASAALAVTRCESGWRVHVKSTYRGLWQFSWRTWAGLGGRGDPADASALEQTRLARKLWASSGHTFSRAWPVCGAGR